jgi:hypothetical protein
MECGIPGGKYHAFVRKRSGSPLLAGETLDPSGGERKEFGRGGKVG